MSKAHIKKTANAREFTEGAYGDTIDATAVYYDVTPQTISGEYKDGILDLTITDIKQ